MQDFAEHRPERDHYRQETKRAAHAVLHGLCDLLQRHAGKQPRADSHNHQCHERMQPRHHHQEQQQ